jgi:predicted ester cyclase
MANEDERILPQADFPLDELTVVILSEGPARAGMAGDEVQRLLNEHLAYTLGLARSGKLLAAGAFIDPNPAGRLTGIGFSRLPPDELAAHEAEDPAMKAGLEGFRVVKYMFPKGVISFAREFESNQESSRRLYEEVFGNGNLAIADELMAPDVVSHGPGAPDQIGTEGIKRQAQLLRTAIPDLAATLKFQVADAEGVTSYWTGSGTHTGDLMLPAGPVGPTGNPISFDELRVDRYAEGRIVESWFIPDRLTLWTQFGLMPSPAR